MRAIGSKSVVSNGTNVVITVCDCAFRNLSGLGVVAFRLNTAIPADAEALPIVFSSNGYTLPLTLVGGESATAAQLSGVGVYLIFYDKSSGTLQLLTFGAPAATAATTGSGN